MNYVIGDFLIRIKNAYLAHKKQVELPYSKAALEIGKILVEEGYLEKISSLEDGKKKNIEAGLKYNGRTPAIIDIKIVSRPSVRYYTSNKEIKKRKGRDFGINILTTNKGIMTSLKAQELGVGGEIICKVS